MLSTGILECFGPLSIFCRYYFHEESTICYTTLIVTRGSRPPSRPQKGEQPRPGRIASFQFIMHHSTNCHLRTSQQSWNDSSCLFLFLMHLAVWKTLWALERCCAASRGKGVGECCGDVVVHIQKDEDIAILEDAEFGSQRNKALVREAAGDSIKLPQRGGHRSLS